MCGPQATRSVAEVATNLAARYLIQLCKHFQHRLPVMLQDTAGRIEFPGGSCALQAQAGQLTLALDAADSAQLQQLQGVVERHLLRFAFREPMQIDWRDG